MNKRWNLKIGWFWMERDGRSWNGMLKTIIDSIKETIEFQHNKPEAHFSSSSNFQIRFTHSQNASATDFWIDSFCCRCRHWLFSRSLSSNTLFFVPSPNHFAPILSPLQSKAEQYFIHEHHELLKEENSFWCFVLVFWFVCVSSIVRQELSV